MNPKKRYEIFKRFQKHNAKPTTELVFKSEFELLISVMLSAQATDVSVNKATKVLFSKANTPEAILTLGLVGLKQYIKSIGLYNVKASNIIKTCQILVEQFHSKIPDTRSELQKLPGVGRKTANVVLNTAFGHPTIAVDTHIFRVANRTKIATGKTPLEVELKLEQVVPQEFLLDAHHWLILHGRYICVARRPKCSICFINDLCEFEQKCFDKNGA